MVLWAVNDGLCAHLEGVVVSVSIWAGSVDNTVSIAILVLTTWTLGVVAHARAIWLQSETIWASSVVLLTNSLGILGVSIWADNGGVHTHLCGGVVCCSIWTGDWSWDANTILIHD